MGQTKDVWMDNQENSDLIDFLENLSDVESPPSIIGIKKQVLNRGINSMTQAQSKTLNDFVQRYKKNNQCNRCGDDNIDHLSDYIFVSIHGLCPLCQHEWNKYEDN